VTASLPRKIIDAICNHLQPHFGILPLNIFTAASFPTTMIYYGLFEDLQSNIMWMQTHICPVNIHGLLHVEFKLLSCLYVSIIATFIAVLFGLAS